MRSGVSLIEAMIGLSLLAGLMMGGTHLIGQMSNSKKITRILTNTEEVIKRNVIQVNNSKVQVVQNIIQVNGSDAHSGRCEVKYYKYSGKFYNEPGYEPKLYPLTDGNCIGLNRNDPGYDGVTKELIKVVIKISFLDPDEAQNGLQFYGDNVDERYFDSGVDHNLNGFMKLPKYRRTIFVVEIAGTFLDKVATRMRKLLFYKKHRWE